ncbi:hypothetical protein [Amycolatopsis ultiminotia]
MSVASVLELAEADIRVDVVCPVAWTRMAADPQAPAIPRIRPSASYLS